MRAYEFINEGWSKKYKSSINCSDPKGFSQRAHCQGKNKNEEVELEERKKKRKPKNAAYGPGPYGWYGYDAGYSGDGGVEETVGDNNEDYHPNDTPRGPETKPTMPQGSVKVDVSDVYDWYKLGMHISDLEGLGKHDFGQGPPSTMFSFGSEEEEHAYIKALQKTGLTTTDIDPVDPNQPKGMPRQKTDSRFNVAEASLGQMMQWPEIVNNVNSAMKAMGWKGQRKDDNSYLFSTKGQETDDQYYMVIIENEGNDMFRYALGTVEEGDPYIGEQATLPMTAASVSELMDSIREGFGLNENFADGRNPQDKGDSKRHGVPTKASISTLRQVAKQGGRKGQLAHWMANMKAGKAKKK